MLVPCSRSAPEQHALPLYTRDCWTRARNPPEKVPRRAARLQEHAVHAARDEAGAGAVPAAALRLVERLGHAALVVQQRAPVQHELQRASRQAGAALRAVGDHRQRARARLLRAAQPAPSCGGPGCGDALWCHRCGAREHTDTACVTSSVPWSQRSFGTATCIAAARSSFRRPDPWVAVSFGAAAGADAGRSDFGRPGQAGSGAPQCRWRRSRGRSCRRPARSLRAARWAARRACAAASRARWSPCRIRVLLTRTPRLSTLFTLQAQSQST